MFRNIIVHCMAGTGIVCTAALALAGSASAAVPAAAPHLDQPGHVGVANMLDVYGTTVTKGSVRLGAAYAGPVINDGTSSWRVVAAPGADIAQNSTNSYDVAGAFPDFDLDYQVLKDDGTPSGYWLQSHFYVPLAGYNRHTCTFTTSDPSTGPANIAPGAPYSCNWSNTSGYNPHPVLTISDGTTVTDKQTATNLLQQNCTRNTNHCAFVGVSLTPSTGPDRRASDLYPNPTPLMTHPEVNWSDSAGETNSVDVSAGTEISLGKLVKATITVTYGHSWETSHEYGGSDTIDLPSGWMGWFTFAPGLQTATGSFVIGHPGSDNYTSTILPNASFTAPLPNGVLTPHACQMVSDSNHLCVAGTAVQGTPVPYSSN